MTAKSEVSRYPLSWPMGWDRTPAHRRQHATFGRRGAVNEYGVRPFESLTVADARDRLFAELGRLGVRDEDVVVSTNLPSRLDGLPYSRASKPSDPGVAVYFRLKKADRVLACDRFVEVADNLAAIAGHIGAIRAIDRYGVGTLEQAFAGYTALPAHAATDWHLVLGVSPSASLEAVEAAFRQLAAAAHPDRGGRHEDMVRLNAARAAARQAKGVA